MFARVIDMCIVTCVEDNRHFSLVFLYNPIYFYSLSDSRMRLHHPKVTNVGFSER